MELVLTVGFLAVVVAIWEVARALRLRPIEPERLPRLKNLKIGEGDVLVVLCRDVMRAGQYVALKEFVESCVPGNRVLVLDRGLDLEVIHRDEESQNQAEHSSEKLPLSP